MAETPEAAAAEAAVDDKPAVGTTVSSGAILAAIAASDGQTPASDAGKADTAASDSPPPPTPAAARPARGGKGAGIDQFRNGRGCGCRSWCNCCGCRYVLRRQCPGRAGWHGHQRSSDEPAGRRHGGSCCGNECARQRRRILFTGCVPRNTHRPIAGHGCLDQTGSQRSPRVPVGCPNRADGGRDDLQWLGPSGRLERLDRLG